MITIDGSKTCTLECPKCRRQSYRKIGLPPGGTEGEDMSLSNFKKLLDYFDHFSFCGQVSDPIFTPNFIEILKMIHVYQFHFLFYRIMLIQLRMCNLSKCEV